MRATKRPRAGLLCVVVSLIATYGCDHRANEPTAAEMALSELQEKYDSLVSTNIENPVQWAAEDLENIGDWEYKVIDLPNTGPASLQETLDKLGDERWEVFWIENQRETYRIILKRPSRSYLSQIPLSQIGRFVIGDSDSRE